MGLYRDLGEPSDIQDIINGEIKKKTVIDSKIKTLDLLISAIDSLRMDAVRLAIDLNKCKNR